MTTLKQERAIKIILKDENKTLGKAMTEAGYKKSTSENPKNLTESDAWKELMEKYLPDKLLAKKHKELLTTPKKVRTYIKGDLESEYEELDSQAISKGLDMGYKLKGKYQPDKIEHSGELNITSEDEKLAEDFIKFRKQNGGNKVNT